MSNLQGRNLKILFWMYTSFDTQFASRHILLDILERLSYEGYTIDILQKNVEGCSGELPEELFGRKINVINIPFKFVKKSNLIARFLSDIVFTYRCKKKIKEHYDAVFIDSSNVLGYTVKVIKSKLKKAKTIYTAQDIFPDNAKYRGKLKETSFPYKLLFGMQKYAYNNLTHIVTISEDMKETLVKNGVRQSKVDVIHNWSYQDEVYCKEDLELGRVEHIMKNNDFNVVYAGNIGVMQNIELILSAACLMKEDRSIKFHIIGDGVYKENLENDAKRKKLDNVFFWPMQSTEMAPLIYSMASINIIPLAENIYNTALPSKTATCLACQQPIIFAIGTNSIFGKKVTEATGCPVIDSNNVEALIDAIYKIKNEEITVETEKFYKEYFCRSVNSKKYVEIISKCFEKELNRESVLI